MATTRATGQTVRNVPKPGIGTPFSSVVDWYKPVSPDFIHTKRTVIYEDLIVPVPHRLHREAVALLGNAQVVELTKEQAKHFGFRADPDSVLLSVIRHNTERLRLFQTPTAESKQNREAEGFWVARYGTQIKQYQKWMGRLKPYLIKAVTLASIPDVERSGFSGELNQQDLEIVHSAAGHQALPMKKMPIVVYLPFKPRQVYTSLSMVD
jgi:hypothetical protein